MCQQKNELELIKREKKFETEEETNKKKYNNKLRGTVTDSV